MRCVVLLVLATAGFVASAQDADNLRLREELDKLRRENVRLKAENESLKRELASLRQAATRPVAEKVAAVPGDEPAIGMTLARVREVMKQKGKLQSETTSGKLLVFKKLLRPAGELDFYVTVDADDKVVRIDRDESRPTIRTTR